MRKFMIFTDRHDRRWICGEALKILFGIVEVGKRWFWNYDDLLRWKGQLSGGQLSAFS